MNDRLYLQDSFRRETVSAIIEKIKEEDKYLLSFAETVFYPGDGGQPADTGTVDGREVIGIEERNGRIYHLLKHDPGGGPCRLVIDFERRFSFMQQHSAQHLLSQVLLKSFGAATLSFSLNEEHASIETDRRSFSEEEREQLENDCNRLVFADLSIRIHLIKEAGELPLRKPPKVSGPIRVIEIDSMDYSACGGTHLRSTGQIGLIKIIGTDRVRGHCRLYFQAGERALRDYQLKSSLTGRMQQLLGVTPDEFLTAVLKLKEEKDRLKKENLDLKYAALKQELAAAKLAGKSFFYREIPGLEAAGIKQMAVEALNQGIGICLFSSDPKSYLLVGDGSGRHDLRETAASLFALLGGRGGGRSQLIEGSFSEPDRIPEALARLQDLFNGE